MIRADAVLVLFTLTSLLLLTVAGSARADSLDTYNVVWTTPSANAAESMPVGGGDVGLNVWVENGELLFYIGRSGTFDENNHMLKLGRVRVKPTPNPFAPGGRFRQELKLRRGTIEISGESPQMPGATIRIWVEVRRPVIHVDVEAPAPISIEARYESWRTADRDIPADCRRSRFPCMSLVGYPGPVVMRADQVAHEGDAVVWYHANRSDDLLIDKELRQQGLEAIKDRIWDPLRNRTFGGLMRGEGMVAKDVADGRYAETDFKAWVLASQAPRKNHSLKVYLHTDQPESLDVWRRDLKALVLEADRNVPSARDAHREWWSDLWERSHILINTTRPDPADPAWQIGRNIQLYRFLQACNAYGKWPTKFNGSVFTFDPVFVESERGVKTETPDYRTWGGGSFTAQNQRLVYWPMLKNGDFDMMPPQFEFYRRTLAAARARTEVYWGHEGASFTEQLENFGLPVGSLYGWPGAECRWGRREPGTPTGDQSIGVVHQFGHQLDFSYMILEYHRFSGNDISRWMPFIDSAVTFFDRHYQHRQRQRTGRLLDENGHLVIFPSRGCESYVDARNPADVIAGLKALLTRLAELPSDLVPPARKDEYRAMLGRVPPLPLKEKDGRPYLAGAEEWSRFQVGEIPQLYAVFPYGLYGVGRPDLDLARFTWSDSLNEDRQKNMREPWYQGGIFAARLGLTDDAREVAEYKLADSGERFPAFRHSDDWAPDHNWLGAGMIGLQEMLMQTPGDRIILFPAWPREWDVDFKLHAPHNTVVTGTYTDGRLERLDVRPPRRRADVEILPGETDRPGPDQKE
jgi:hypothetical protein